MFCRIKIRHGEDFEKQSIGGRKVARVVTLHEKYYLIRLNNRVIRFRRVISKLIDEIKELENRERDLYHFIKEREGLL